MGKTFLDCAAKTFPFLSTSCVFHIAQLISNAKYQPHYGFVILYVFPLGHVYTFVVFKSYSKFCIFLTSIRIFFAYSAFKEENELLRVKNK